MPAAAPHYLLFSEASSDSLSSRAVDGPRGRWKFVLEATDGSSKLEAADNEEEHSRERLELLAVVRGLEALPQPSRVTLVTSSRYVARGMRFGLAEWRENDWQWEHFGQMLPIKNVDLWKRVDHATRIHDIQCRTLRFDAAHVESAEPQARLPSGRVRQRTPQSHGLGHRAAQWMHGLWSRAPARVAQLL